VVLAVVVTGPDWGTLIEFIALGLGSGLGVGLGVRVASKPIALTPGESASQGDTKQTLQAVASLLAGAIGFALVGFVCGAIASSFLLIGLTALRIASGIAVVTLANLFTGLVAGAVAGYLVERVGERFQLTSVEARGAMVRSAVVAGAVGVVVGLLAGGLAGYPAAGLILSTLGVAIVSTGIAIATAAARGS